jgi:ribokinase
MNGRVIVLGNAAIDLIQRVERLPVPGQTVVATATERCPGGKGLNQAVAAARAGVPVRFVAGIGADADGAELRAALSRETGLDTVWLASPVPTDLSVLWVGADGENMIVSSIGSALSLSEQDMATALGALGRGDLLLMQGNLGGSVTSTALRLARSRGALTMLNVAPVQSQAQELAAASDVIVVNDGEAEALCPGTSGRPDLLLRGETRMAVVTRGGRDILLATPGGVASIAVPAVTAVDTAGAGDVFTGTFAAGLLQGASPEAAARRAAAAAAISVQRPGTTPSFPTREEMAAIPP